MPRSLVPEGIVALTSDPTGVRAGQTYWNSSTGQMRTFNGTTWINVGPGAAATDTDWVDLTLNSGYGSFRAKGNNGAAFPAYRRLNGIVYLKGLVTPPNPSSNESAITVVPAGYRPLEQRHFIGMASTPSPVYLGVTAQGTVLLKFALTNPTSWFSLDGISFPMEQ